MTIVLTVPLILTSVLMIGEKVKETYANMLQKNLQTQVIETQSEINDIILNGVNTTQQKNALKEKNNKLKMLIKQIEMNKSKLKKPKGNVGRKMTISKKPVVSSKPSVIKKPAVMGKPITAKKNKK